MNKITSIKLCSVPFTPTNQLDFVSVDKQRDYFAGKVVFSYDKCKYQPRTSTIQVKGYVDALQNCNYGYYTNSYNGITKTFYFWIVQKNLIATETTELVINIDVIQTWLFDYRIPQCFVEREHVIDDSYGKHTVPEDFELGDYVVNSVQQVTQLSASTCYILACSDASVGSGEMGGIFGGVYCGYKLICYDSSHVRNLSDLITTLCENGKADSIAFIFAYPEEMIDLKYSDYGSGNVITESSGTLSKEITFNNSLVKQFGSNGDYYYAKNNKLYSYPYKFITVCNSSGGNIVLKYENFKNGFLNPVAFQLDGVLMQNSKFTLTPKHYCNEDINYANSIELSGFGLCSWNNDNYANWYAQNINSIATQSDNARASFNAGKTVAGNNYRTTMQNADANYIRSMLGTASGALGQTLDGKVGSGISTAINGGLGANTDFFNTSRSANNDLTNTNLLNTTNYQNTIASIMASVQDASVQPNTCKGDTSACGLDMARGTNTFYIKQSSIKKEYAMMIDNYFQMYGYKVNEVKRPDTTSRQYWNYIKCVNAVALGNIPQEDREVIAGFYNNGITFWHDENYIYHYEYTNYIKGV